MNNLVKEYFYVELQIQRISGDHVQQFLVRMLVMLLVDYYIPL